MKYISIIMCLFILAAWLFFGVSEFWSAKNQPGWQRLLTFFASTLVTIGALGFFGSALSAMGGLDWLPHTFEWPVGHATGVVTTKDGYRVVPLTASDRIQIYDSNWKFLRGWNVNAGAGTFKLYVTDTNHINVITARLNLHYVYDLNGDLLSKNRYPVNGAGYSSFPSEGSAFTVPTPVWLWVFTSPFYSWGFMAAGFLYFFAKHKTTKRAKRKIPELL